MAIISISIHTFTDSHIFISSYLALLKRLFLFPFFFFRSSFSFSVLPSSLFSFAVGGLGHRQISPSLSSLHVRTLLSRIAPCLCIMFCTRLQTPAVCPIQDKCGCSGVPCALSPLARFLRQLRPNLIWTYSKGEPLRSPSVFSCYALRGYFFTP